MTIEYVLLKNEIQNELSQIERSAERAIKAFDQANDRVAERDFYLDSSALNMENFYTGIEKLFVRIAKHIDHHFPGGDTWHKELLLQMATPLDEIRPAVITQALQAQLSLFLKFRHVVRHLYAFNLDQSDLGKLVHALGDALRQFKSQILEFTAFLEQVGRLA